MNSVSTPDRYPRRIVCMTEESTELLYLLGEEHRIVGISGFTVRPPRARKEKPKVSAFTSAKIDKILALNPDLVVGFSDLQADIAAELIRRGVNVYIFNQRSVDEILSMICQLGALVGASLKTDEWLAPVTARIDSLKARAAKPHLKPKVYFEEWNDPLISGIQWVAELIEIAGGIDLFPENSNQPLGVNRIIADPGEVVKRQPDIIIGSWCGKKFRPQHVVERPGWQDIPAVRNGQIFEIKSPLILQPGPAALTEGLDQLLDIVEHWRQRQE